jgi:hypothetical protein
MLFIYCCSHCEITCTTPNLIFCGDPAYGLVNEVEQDYLYTVGFVVTSVMFTASFVAMFLLRISKPISSRSANHPNGGLAHVSEPFVSNDDFDEEDDKQQ